MKYKRILLKLSGEVLAGKKETGIDFQRVLDLAREIKEVSSNWYCCWWWKLLAW